MKALVVTAGRARARWSTPAASSSRFRACKPTSVVDPTGCGDAYRAGLLYGIAQGCDWPHTGRLASLMGAIKIAQRGGQNHSPRARRSVHGFAKPSELLSGEHPRLVTGA